MDIRCGCPVGMGLGSAHQLERSMLARYLHRYTSQVGVVEQEKQQRFPFMALLNPNTSYSMGCASMRLECSICGGIQGPAVARTCTCYDCNYTDLAAYGQVKGGVLHYMMAQAPVFFEASIVRVPAEFSCQGEGV